MASKDRSNKAAKQAALKQHVSENVPIGILVYDGSVPVGWCSVAPASSLRALHAAHESTPYGSVWAIICFFVPRSHRGQGVTKALIEGAISYAKTQGASHIEAYPVDSDSTSYRFMGFPGMFEEAGFEYVGMAGSKRHRMCRSV
jgi:GNAT superfamily N-acetyltransferase